MARGRRFGEISVWKPTFPGAITPAGSFQMDRAYEKKHRARPKRRRGWFVGNGPRGQRVGHRRGPDCAWTTRHFRRDQAISGDRSPGTC